MRKKEIVVFKYKDNVNASEIVTKCKTWKEAVALVEKFMKAGHKAYAVERK